MPRLLLLTVSLCLLAVIPGQAKAAEEPSFADDVAPILMERCLACHNGKKSEGGYRVDTYRQVLQEGDSGAAPVTAGDLDDSELRRRIASDSEFERMPLDAEPLSAKEIKTISDWIASGAVCKDSVQESPLASIVPAPVYRAAPAVYSQPLPVTALAFSPNGSQLYVSGYHEVSVWNVKEGTLARRIGNIGQRVYGIDLHPAGKQMAIACGQPGRYGEVRIIEIESGDMLQALAGTDDVVLDARYDPTGERLAVAAADTTVRIYRTDNWQLLRTITSHSDWVNAVAWSSDGKRLATASRDKTAKVFRVADGESLITYTNHMTDVLGVAFHADSKRVYSAGADYDVDLWKLSDGQRVKENELSDALMGIAPMEELLLVPSVDKNLYGVSRSSGDTKHTYQGHVDWVLSAAGHAATQRVAAGGIDGRVIVWNAENSEKVSEFLAMPGHTP